MDLPKDPYMLLSMINMKLRDDYSDLDSLCEDLDIDRKQLESKLGTIDYKYIPGINQFR